MTTVEYIAIGYAVVWALSLVIAFKISRACNCDEYDEEDYHNESKYFNEKWKRFGNWK